VETLNFMAQGQGFFKGEKKKKKKGEGAKQISAAPVFSMPKVMPKGKEKY
jgi:hypothetical protein